MIKPYGCTSDINICFMDGWSRGSVSGDLLSFINEDQLGDTQSSGPFTKLLKNEHIYTQTHEHAHSSRSNSCRKHLERSNAHMSASLYAALHFSRESTLVERRIHSPVLQFKPQKHTYGCDFCQHLPVPPPLPASPL